MSNYRIEIEAAENGFIVTVPDMAERAKKKAEAKKSAAQRGNSVPSYEPYLGDCTEKYTAKSINEAMKYVKAALEQIPSEFEDAFKEATDKVMKS